MEWLAYVSLGFVLGALVAWLYRRSRYEGELVVECRRLERELCEWEEQATALGEYTTQLQQQREARKAEIVEWLQEGVRLQSSEIADRYDISTRTVRNYMTELVEEGSVKQSDVVGRGVYYEIIEK